MPAAKKQTKKAPAPEPEVPSAREGSDVAAASPAGYEPIGPAAEHEDHEGGATDTLAMRGVRGEVPDPSAAAEGQPRVAPSFRERNPRVPLTSAASASKSVLAAHAAQQREAAAEEDGEPRVVRVKALRAGQYPASPSQRRKPGAVFDYTLAPGEEVLPSWLTAVGEDGEPSGEVRSRRAGEGVDGEKLQATQTITLEVPAGTAATSARGVKK